MNRNSIGDGYLALLTQVLNQGVDLDSDEVRYHLNNIKQLKSPNIEEEPEIIPDFSNEPDLADIFLVKEDPHND
ncbi:hypothetical protein [Vibrio vulnificus]|uniref:hypothetical protein n=1 Tax=Vibrio vulnificus TaxID=672 RepID=UPI00102BDFCE|nr:hypothetical protein [Vibrio vulnificus]RZR39139.1 hypothetical protein D8T58_23360 [Vibrio vulnificus]